MTCAIATHDIKTIFSLEKSNPEYGVVKTV
jgi:hypothetical protein